MPQASGIVLSLPRPLIMDRATPVIPIGPKAKPKKDKLSRSDDELMLLARGGAGHAFDEVVRRYQEPGFRIARKYLGDSSLAQDATQNAFVRIYHSLADYHPRGKFQSYFFCVLINECKMMQRSAKRRSRRNHQFYLLDSVRPLPLSDDLILAREKSREIETAMLALSSKLRAPLVLRFAGDCSYQEIADTLDVPLGTVKSRIFAGLAKLRTFLDRGTV